MTRHVLIGAGPAAFSAAQTIRALDPMADITMVSAEPHGYYSRPGLAYYLAKEEPVLHLCPGDHREVADTGVRTISAPAVAIERGAKVVRLGDGRALPYDRLLLATGSAAIPLRVPGADLDGVTKLDTLDDARDLVARARHAKAAVVVGGGSTALEIVEGLLARRVDVHYFLRKDRYWSDVLSPEESRIVEESLRKLGVKIHYFTQLGEILGKNGRVVGVVTEKGERIACDIVAVAIGVRPQTRLASESGLECGRGVRVDEHLCTSDPSIFAAGDVAETTHDGEPLLEVLWNPAIHKGLVAGRNMAGDTTSVYERGVPLNVTRIAGFKVTIIGTVGSGRDHDLEGLSRGDSEQWSRLGKQTSVVWEDDETRIRLELTGDEITGAIVMGNQRLSYPLQDIVEGHADISSIADQLVAPGAPVDELITRYHEQWMAQRV